MDTKERNLQDYLTVNLGIKFKSEQDYNENAPEWALSRTNHYRVTLTREGRRMTFWFYQGQGIKNNPDLESVIECLASDRSLAQYSLEEFGDEFGWNKNTIKDYRHLVNITKRYERLIGSDSLLEEIYEKVTA